MYIIPSRYELSGSKYVTSLPKGTHSTKGCGMTEPDPAGAYTGPDGLVVPMGKGQPATRGYSSLLYNEYPYWGCLGLESMSYLWVGMVGLLEAMGDYFYYLLSSCLCGRGGINYVLCACLGVG